MTDDLEVLLAERTITRVILAYSRAVDRYGFGGRSRARGGEGTPGHGVCRVSEAGIGWA